MPASAGCTQQKLHVNIHEGLRKTWLPLPAASVTCSCFCVFSMKQLRDRVMKLKEEHGHIYHLVRTEGKPTINWGNMMDEKLVNKSTANMCSTVLHLVRSMKLLCRARLSCVHGAYSSRWWPSMKGCRSLWVSPAYTIRCLFVHCTGEHNKSNPCLHDRHFTSHVCRGC